MLRLGCRFDRSHRRRSSVDKGRNLLSGISSSNSFVAMASSSAFISQYGLSIFLRFITLRPSGTQPAPLAVSQVTRMDHVDHFLVALEGDQVCKRQLRDTHLVCVQDQEDDLKRTTGAGAAADDPLAAPDSHWVRPRRALHDKARLLRRNTMLRNVRKIPPSPHEGLAHILPLWLHQGEKDHVPD